MISLTGRAHQICVRERSYNGDAQTSDCMDYEGALLGAARVGCDRVQKLIERKDDAKYPHSAKRATQGAIVEFLQLGG